MNTLLAETRLPSGQALHLVAGDLTAEAVDAIVNAANARLLHGAGVAGAIRQAGGPAIQAESDEWVRTRGPVRPESPAWTSGGRLPCRYVIHAVGPQWGEGGEDEKLAAAVRGALRTADGLGMESIAFPAISTGIFGFPRERAGQVMLQAIREHFAAGGSGLRTVRLVLLDEPTRTAFQKAWHDHFGPEPQT